MDFMWHLAIRLVSNAITWNVDTSALPALGNILGTLVLGRPRGSLGHRIKVLHLPEESGKMGKMDS